MSAFGRRSFLTGVAGAAVAAPAAAGMAQGISPASAPAGPAPASVRYAFEGRHQAGVVTPQQSRAAFLSFDVTASARAEVADLLRTVTDRIRGLTAGGAGSEPGLTGPPADSGVIGPDIPPDGLTVTASVGASLFDDRFGLTAQKPALLRQMEDFPNDALDRAICDGDLLLQVCASSDDTVIHAVRDIARHTRGGMQVRWRQDGFVSPPRPSGTPRNLMGFRDGTSNPDRADATQMADLVWTGSEEPAWAVGGTYHVIRVIRMFVEFWDRVNIREQENMIGRRRDSGAPLTMTHEHDDPHYELDPQGESIPTSAHIRLANDRSPTAMKTRILRRAYNYDGGIDLNGDLDMGLVFVAFNRDLEKQFVAIQKRLADEPLVDYISPKGGGYFYALPGVRDASDWLGRGLLT